MSQVNKIKLGRKSLRRGMIMGLGLVFALGLVGACANLRLRSLEQKKDTVSVLTYDLTTTINAPVKEVWDLTRAWSTNLVGDLKYENSWGEFITGIGNHSTGTMTLGGTKVRMNETLVEYEEERIVRFVYSGDMRGSLRVTMEPKGNQTFYSLSAHVFFLPDSLLSRTLNAFLEQGLLDEYMNQVVTRWAINDFAALEKKKPEEIKMDAPPEYTVFADAYLTAGQTFKMTPEKLFQNLNSREGLKALLPFDSIEPAGDSPQDFQGIGNHYRVTASKGLSAPLTYDLVIVQYDPPGEARYYLYTAGVAMEIDVLAVPDPIGSKALILFILDLPKSVSGRAMDAMIHLSDIDQQAQKGLAELNHRQ